MEKHQKKTGRILGILCVAAILVLGLGALVLQGAGGRKMLRKDQIVTVGQQGDFVTISEALAHLSKFSPVYQQEPVRCEVRILSGTVIREQVAVTEADLHYITITSDDAVVPVESMGWDENGLNYHDLRGDVAFIGGEDGARLPVIGTVFQLTQIGQRGAVGYFVNRNSQGAILPGCGFDGFYDGCIANNESSIIMRDSVSRNMFRWGIHGRHNSEITARGADLTGCGLAAYADRVADLDVRKADMKGSQLALDSRNLSRVNANGCEIYYCSGTKGFIVYAEAGGEVNCTDPDIQYGNTHVFGVFKGGTIYAGNSKVVGVPEDKKAFSQEPNALTADGIIYQ